MGDEAESGRRITRVLVADDDDEIRALLVAAFRLDGYDVVEARDGASALHQFTGGTHRPDVVVADLRMPVMNGLTLLGGLRADGWLMPIIVMTAYAEQLRERVERLGADALFAKPFDIDDLRMAVMNMLSPNRGPRAFARTCPDG